MIKKEYLFTCTGDFEDLSYLYQLFTINGVDSKMRETKANSNQMGIEEILIVIISSEIIPAIISTLKIWFQNRKKELFIKDEKQGKEIHIVSRDGEAFSDSVMEKFLTFFEDQDNSIKINEQDK